jgi:hypothetical protein
MYYLSGKEKVSLKQKETNTLNENKQKRVVTMKLT